MFRTVEVTIMRQLRVSAILLLVTLYVCAALAAQESGRKKKLVEWGWDQPDTKFMRQNIHKMERLPFDGLVFHVISSKGGDFSWELWGSRRFELAELQDAVDDLRSTPFRRLTDRFMRVNVTPGNVDWFDDRQWGVVLQNYTVAAQVAKHGGCKGFMFDVEQYGQLIFCYEKMKRRGQKTFAEYQAKVRQRGQEWMRAVNAQFPDITILMTYAYSISDRDKKGSAAATYGLLADFLDGMLDVCVLHTTLVDAWEGAYHYRRKSQFVAAYDTIRAKSIQWTAVPEAYRRHVRAAFGIWMDAIKRQGHWHAWHTDDLSKNYFTPDQFENTVRLALETSDEYVWIYTQQPRWWTNERLPKAYVDALLKARDGKNAKPPSGRS